MSKPSSAGSAPSAFSTPLDERPPQLSRSHTAQAATRHRHRQLVPATMQAIIYRRYGDSQVLQSATLPVPKIKPGEMLIRVRAASVNPIDIRLRQGEARWLLPGHFPRIPGYDVAGEVVVPPQRGEWHVGDRVLAFLSNRYGGAAAQYVLCKPFAAQRLPDDLAYIDAAALPLAGSTALQSLRGITQLAAGERVLINGASGGVGSFATQIAKAYGGHVTAVASGSREKFVRWLGADEFIDYEQQDYTQTGLRWDIVFDVAGKSSYLKARSVLSDQGRFVSTEPSLRGLLVSCLTWPLAKRGRVMLARPKVEDLAELVRLVKTGKMKVILDEVFPLHDTLAAHQRLERGEGHGKLVLSVP